MSDTQLVHGGMFLPQRHHGKAGADTNGPSLCQSADFNLVLQVCQSLKLAGKTIGVAKCVPPYARGGGGTPMEGVLVKGTGQGVE